MATIGTFVSTDTASLQLSDPIVGFAVAAPSSTSAGKPETSGFTLADETQNGGMTGSLLASGGAVWVIASFLAFGLLLAFTPCVLPMYPILSATTMPARTSARMLENQLRRIVSAENIDTQLQPSPLALASRIIVWGFILSVRGIGGRKSHPEFHRVQGECNRPLPQPSRADKL